MGRRFRKGGEEKKKKKKTEEENKNSKKKKRRRRKSSCGAGRCLHTFFPVGCSQPKLILSQEQKEKRRLLADIRLSVCVCHALTAIKIASYLVRCGRKVLSSCDTNVCVKS